MPLKGLVVNIEPVQDLHGYDHPWPGGGGKNLLKNMMQSQTISGITITVNGDGSFKTSGTAEANINLAIYSKRTIADLVGGNIVISGCPANGSENTYSITLYYHDSTGKTIDPAIQAETGNGLSVNVPANAADVSIALKISSGTNVSNLIWYPMLRLSSTDASYTPYSNICPISGWTGCNVTRTGKNLLDYHFLFSGSYARHGTYFDIYELKLLPNTAYTFSTNENAKLNSNHYPYLFGNSLSLSSANNNVYKDHPRTVTTGVDGKLYIAIRIENLNDATPVYSNYENSTRYVQLEEGSSVTAYEPFGVTIPISWESEAGTVYGGTLDVVNGKLTVTYEIHILNDLAANSAAKSGSSLLQPGRCGYYLRAGTNVNSWLTNSKYTGGDTNPNKVMFYSDVYNIGMKSSLEVAAFTAFGIGLGSYGGFTTLWFNVSEVDCPDADSFITYMNAMSPTICYELATPIEIPLTSIPEITTLLGTNNIWADCGDVTVTYGAYLETVKAHAELLGDSILSAIAPLEANYTASRDYVIGDYLFVGTKFYKVISAISSEASITIGTNVKETTVAEQLLTKPAILG